MRKKFLANILAAVALCLGTFTAVSCSKNEELNKQPSGEIAQTQTAGGMEIEGNKKDKVRVTSTALAAKNYATYGVSPLADSAYVLEATITPDYAVEFVKIDWTLAFKDAASDWATGKNVADYVKITPESDGARVAVVECLQPFGEVIVVKALARGRESVYGTCTCNYILRPAEIKAELEDGTRIIFKKGSLGTFAFEPSNTGKGKVIFSSVNGGVGTKDNSVYTLCVTVDNSIVQNLNEWGFAVKSSTATFATSLSSAQLGSGEGSIQTMLHLPGADAAIVGDEQSNLIKQGYLWAMTATNADGVLSEEEWTAYHNYREAICRAWSASEDFLITLTLTQYDKQPSGNVLTVYETQMDFAPAEILPDISAGDIQLNYENIDF